MTTQYTSILKLALPVQGELSGTWGDVVNDNITSIVEEAVAGRAVINTWTTNSHVLTTADGTTSESRCAMLEFTDTGTALTGAATVVCPSASKLYVCKNDSGQQVTVKTAAGTGVAIPDGQTMFVFCDGTNVEQCETNFNSLSFNGYTLNFGGAVTTAGAFTTSGAYALTLTTTGATNVTLPTTGTLATLDGTETLTNKTFTAPTITSPTLTGTISATDLDISGNTTIGDASSDTLTVTATITSNLLFTDATYDIGATGATRPRDLFLSRDAVLGGTITTTGNASLGGDANVVGSFSVNTDKFQVAAATGNTLVAGTLGVTGATTATGGLNVDTINEITAAGGVTIDSVVLKDGGITTTGNTIAGANIIIKNGGNSVDVGNGTGDLQIGSAGSTQYTQTRYGTSAGGSFLMIGKSRSTTVGTPGTIVNDDDQVGVIRFAADDGVDLVSRVAEIEAAVDGTPGADDTPGRLTFSTTEDGAQAVTERMRIDNAGRVGIGTNAISGYNTYGDGLVVRKSSIASSSGITIQAPQNTGYSSLYFGDPDDTKVGWAEYSHSADSLTFGSGNAVAMVLDSSQRVLVSTTSARTDFSGNTTVFQIEGTSLTTSSAAITRNTNDAFGPVLYMNKSRGTSRGSDTIVNSGDTISEIIFGGADSNEIVRLAQINATVDGTPGLADMPGRLTFHTTADGASSSTERMRIDNAGRVTIGGISSAAWGSAYDVLTVGSSIGGASYTGSSNAVFITNNAYNDNTNWKYATSSSAAAYTQYAGTHTWQYAGSGTADNNLTWNTALKLDSSGRLLAGISSSISGYSVQTARTDGTVGFSALRYSNDAYGSYIHMAKSRNTTIGSNTIVQNNDALGYINWSGSDGTDVNSLAAGIWGEVDGTPGANDMPGRLVFKTTADGAASSTERMRIQSNGFVGIGNGSTAYYPLHVYTSTDGVITRWRREGGTNNPLFEIELTESNSKVNIRSSGSTVGPLVLGTGSGEYLQIETDGHILMPTDEVKIQQSGDELVDFIMDSNRSGAGQTLGRTRFYWSGTETSRIEGLSGSDTTNKDDGEIRFLTRLSGSTIATAMQIHDDGVVTKNKQPYAAGSYSGSNLTSGAIIPINSTTATQGGITITTSGTGHKFTVPHGGVYIIGWNHLAGSTGGDRIEVRTNNVKISGGECQDVTTSSNDSFNSTYIGYLSASDYVTFHVTFGEVHGNASYNRMFIALLG